MDKPDSKFFFRLIRKKKASSNETAAMVIKGDQNQDVSDHKEQADLFNKTEKKFGVWFVHQIVVKIQFVFMFLSSNLVS
jgi:hypothetical protein